MISIDFWWNANESADEASLELKSGCCRVRGFGERETWYKKRVKNPIWPTIILNYYGDKLRLVVALDRYYWGMDDDSR